MSGHSLVFYSRFQGVFRRPPITDQSLRLVATGALSSSSRIAFFDCQVSGSGAEAESISCIARAGFEEHVTGMRPP